MLRAKSENHKHCDGNPCHQEILSLYATYFILLLCTILFTVSCGQGKTWEDALTEAAPPNPHTMWRPQTIAEPVSESEEQQPVTTDAESADSGETRTTRPADTQLVINIENVDECRNGAIRVYLDGRYHGAVNDDGEFSALLTPGDYQLVVWDSSGKWKQGITINRRQTTTVTFTCDQKEAIVMQRSNPEQGDNH